MESGKMVPMNLFVVEGSVVFVPRETQSGAKIQGPAVDSYSIV